LPETTSRGKEKKEGRSGRGEGYFPSAWTRRLAAEEYLQTMSKKKGKGGKRGGRKGEAKGVASEVGRCVKKRGKKKGEGKAPTEDMDLSSRLYVFYHGKRKKRERGEGEMKATASLPSLPSSFHLNYSHLCREGKGREGGGG